MKMTSEYYSALKRALAWVYRNDGIDLCELSGGWRDDRKLKFGVNWSAQGTKPASDARDYARALNHAADICDRLNELELIIDYNAELTMGNDERKELIMKLIDAFEGGYFVSTVRTELCE